MRLLTRGELEAVLAHELSHVKNRDILTMTMASFIAMIATMIMQSFFFSALFGRTGRATVASFITVILLLVGPLFVERACSAAPVHSRFAPGNL